MINNKFLVLLLLLSLKINTYSQPVVAHTASLINKFHDSNKTTYHSSTPYVGLTITQLGNVGRNVEIQVKDARSHAIVKTYNTTINAARGGTISILDNAPIWGDGTFYLTIVFLGAPALPPMVFNDDLIVRESTINFLHRGMNFTIHYTNKAFDHHPLGNAYTPTYLANLETIIKDVWEREITDWRLCDGVAAVAGGSAINTPSDKDNTYHFIVHNISELGGNINDFFFANGSDNDRVISLDSRITTVLNGIAHTAQYEKEMLYMTIAHEFYHGIQWSHVPASIIPNIGVELPKRFWLIEGQAKSLETIFMTPGSGYNYSTSYTNSVYVNNAFTFSYDYFTKDFINEIFDDGVAFPRAYTYPNLNSASYYYAMFWRHLFEHNFASATPLVDKMKLYRETCIDNTSSVYSNIETNIMNNNLAAAGGYFTTYDKALIDFTEKLYFHDQAYNTAANRAILFAGIAPLPTSIWYDPNPAPNDNFYSRISTFNEPIERLNNAGNTSFTRVYNIPSSFGHRAHRFKFKRNAEIKIDFASNPGANPRFGDFNVDCYLLNGVTIEQKQNIALNAGTGAGTINLNIDESYKEIVILVTRLDANEGTANNYPDYRISLAEVAGTAGTKYSWPTPKKVAAKGLFFGGQHSIKGQFSDFRTSGGANGFCKGIEIEASANGDERNVYALEAGRAYSDATSTNIGHFRYGNIQNVVASNTNVKVGDKIGVIQAGTYMYFMESDAPLTSAGENLPNNNARWINPLRPGGLSPYTDNANPVINSIQLVNATGANVVSPLYQKLDIIIDAYDPATRFDGTGDPNLKCGIHKITVKFIDAAGNEIVHSNGDPTRIEFFPGYNSSNSKYELPQGANALTDVYEPSSTPSKFVYIATNKPYSGTPDQYWNTKQKNGDVYTVDARIPSEALFKEGSIKIEVTVEDLQGKQATQSKGL